MTGILSVLLFTCIIFTGCTGEQKNPVTNGSVTKEIPLPIESPVIQVPETPVVTPASSEPGNSSQVSGTIAPQVPPLEKTTVPTLTATSFPKFPDPYVKNLGYSQLYKSDISNCLMQTAFPEIAGDPTYGLINVRDLKLTTVSPQRMQQFERDYLPQNSTSNIFITTHCYGLPDTPYWNFLEVKALLQAQNARQAEYNITLVIQYQGVDGPEISTTQKLVPDQILPYYLYIPIPTRDIGYITGMKFKFNQTA